MVGSPGIVRVIVGFGSSVEKTAQAIKEALRDPEVDCIVFHKPGKGLYLNDGREVLIDAEGHVVKLEEVVCAT